MKNEAIIMTDEQIEILKQLHDEIVEALKKGEFDDQD